MTVSDFVLGVGKGRSHVIRSRVVQGYYDKVDPRQHCNGTIDHRGPTSHTGGRFWATETHGDAFSYLKTLQATGI